MEIKIVYEKTDPKNKRVLFQRKYLVEFSIKAYQELTDKDRKKIYNIQRIIFSFGCDNEDKGEENFFHFTNDDNDKEHLLDCIEIVSKK